MRAVVQQLAVTLRLHYRNRMALFYGYLFPAIFLAAFLVLYRHDDVPLVRHMGELLTVTVLGGACFGLPTTLVSERERGVWRRYRLAPVAIGTLVTSTVLGRYVILLTAGLLQIGLAMAAGMPRPQHPADLWLAFTLVSFAFLGLGLVIATMADTVPAVQALGQCIFLPMLIIGGVAVPLYVLPEWAQHISAFFPGRYAVQALQSAVNGAGTQGARFSLAALLIIGGAAAVTGARMFRWDAEQRFATVRGKGWVVVALGAWAAVGVLAEADGRAVSRAASAPRTSQTVADLDATVGAAVLTPQERAAASAAGTGSPAATVPAPTGKGNAEREPAVQKPRPERKIPASARAAERPSPPPATTPASSTPTESPAVADTPSTAPATPSTPAAPIPAPWRAVTLDDINKAPVFVGLPPDEGVVTPMAPPDEEPDPLVAKQLGRMRDRLLEWEPGLVDDPVQRVRNYLYVAVVPDMFQMPIERYVPWLVFERLQEEFIKEDLVKLLYWVGRRPFEGDESAIDHLRPPGIDNGPDDVDELRRRTSIYARKLLKRLLTA